MKPTIALFIHQPRCSVQCANGMLLAFSTHYNIKLFTWHPLEDNFFDDVDIVAFPGGDGDSESWHWLMKHHAPRIRDFVARGGRYLGICMGAYWAGSHYFDILKDVDAVQYITQPNTDTRRPQNNQSSKRTATSIDSTKVNKRLESLQEIHCSRSAFRMSGRSGRHSGGQHSSFT